MAAAQDSPADDVGARRLHRVTTLINEVTQALETYVADVRAEKSRYRQIGLMVEQGAIDSVADYLTELGLDGDANRLQSAWNQLLGKSFSAVVRLDQVDLLNEELGLHVPSFDTEEELRAWQDEVSVFLIGEADALAKFLKGLRISLVSPTPDQDRTSNQVPGDSRLRILDGGYVYFGHENQLCGKPLAVLKELLVASDKRCSLEHLLAAIWPGTPIQPEVVTRHVSTLRNSLRRAMKKAKKRSPKDPLPHIDRGSNLAWRLDLPLK